MVIHEKKYRDVKTKKIRTPQSRGVRKGIITGLLLTRYNMTTHRNIIIDGSFHQQI